MIRTAGVVALAGSLPPALALVLPLVLFRPAWTASESGEDADAPMVANEIEGEAGSVEAAEEMRRDRVDVDPADAFEIRLRGRGRWDAEGSRWGSSVRIRWTRGTAWSAGLLADRDPGEPRAIDLWKAALRYRAPAGWLESLTVGSLRCEFARGLLFFSRSRVDPGSLSPGKTGRTGRGIGIDLSTTEGYDLHGVAVGVRASSRVLLSALVSRTALDVSRGDGGAIVAIRRSGDHSATSPADRGALGLLSAAGRAELRLGATSRLGGTLAIFRYSEPLDPPPDGENARVFRGRRALFLSVDGRAGVGGTGLFWEVGVDPARGAGGLAGIESGRGPTRWGLLLRHYGPGFVPPFGNAFQDGGTPSNESGLFTSVGWRPMTGLRLALRVDTLGRPWPRNREPFPTGRREASIEASWRPIRRLDVRARILDRRGESVETGSDPPRLGSISLRRLRVQVDWRDPPIAFRVRAEGAFPGREGEGEGTGRGTLLYLQSRYRPAGPLTLDLRVALFGSGAADADVYAWEPDLPGSMRIFRGSGEGVRAVVVGRVHATERLTLTMKWGTTRRFPQEDRTASGAAAVRQSEVALQLDYDAGG